MKKVAIVTINDYENLGNRLQNLAVQTVLQNRYDVVVETMNNFANRPNFDFVYCILKQTKRIMKKTLGLISPKYKYINKFAKFNKNIKFSKFALYKGCNYKKINDSYDYFVVGSDQVWNPYFFRGYMYNNFLMFADASKKITFSPSIAIDSIPAQYEEQYQKGLKTFDKIFIREKNSVELVKKYADCEVESMIDPTMFLSANDWRQFEKNVKIKNKYVLCYFLGSKSQKTKLEIEEFAKKHNLTIIDVTDDKQTRMPRYAPDEFLYLIDNAEYIFTDSFHGSALSFVFNKKFVIFERNDKLDMSVRISSLVEDLSIEQVLRKNMKLLSDVETQKIEYDNGKEFIDKQKTRFFEYLDEKLK